MHGDAIRSLLVMPALAGIDANLPRLFTAAYDGDGNAARKLLRVLRSAGHDRWAKLVRQLLKRARER